MSAENAKLSPPERLWTDIRELDRAEGSSAHRYVTHLVDPAVALRDVADAIQFLCTIHGNHPGLFDIAAEACLPGPLRSWLEDAARHFHDERVFLVALAAAAGPPPGTPGNAESEAAVAAQRHALETLARSDRRGCSAGAAIALLLEWTVIRDLLNCAADRLGIDTPPLTLAVTPAVAEVIQTEVTSPAIERAMLFGFRQLLAQHQGLWDLLEARADARNRD